MFKCELESVLDTTELDQGLTCGNASLRKADMYEMFRGDLVKTFCMGCAPQLVEYGWSPVDKEQAKDPMFIVAKQEGGDIDPGLPEEHVDNTPAPNTEEDTKRTVEQISSMLDIMNHKFDFDLALLPNPFPTYAENDPDAAARKRQEAEEKKWKPKSMVRHKRR